MTSSSLQTNDVRYYGAKGDGVTDDTAAFKAAIAATKALYIPAGVYLISQPLIHPLDIHITSDGATLKATAPMAYILGNSAANDLAFFECSGLILDANNLATSGASWYQVNNHASGARNLWVKNAVGDGILLTQCQGGTWSGMRATACGVGMRLVGCNSAVFVAPSAKDNVGDGLIISDYKVNQVVVASGGCNIYGLHSEHNGGCGLHIQNTASRFLISGGWMERNGSHGVWIENAAMGCTIDGLRISGPGVASPENHGVHITGSQRAVSIQNNFIARESGAATYGQIFQQEASISNLVTPNWDGVGGLLQ